jgi:hypothetical protein
MIWLLVTLGLLIIGPMCEVRAYRSPKPDYKFKTRNFDWLREKP